MSLRVWLPLNGNLNNQGASNCNPVQTTAPTYVNGKIGSKAMSTGAFYLPAAEVAKFYNNTAMSWCFWIYPTGTGSAATPIIGQSNTSAGDNRMFSIYQYPNAVDLHLSWQSNESNTTFLATVLSNVLTANTWNHCAITYNGSIAKIYVNNILVGSSNGTSTRTNFSYNVPIPTTSLRYLNDLRIYDHCLSEKEIKEISKALICHYPLDGNGKGRDNYFINSNFYTGTTSNWGGVNGSTISIVSKDNKKCITGTKGTSSYLFCQTLNNYSYTAGTVLTYTISLDVYVEETGTIEIHNWITTTQASGWQEMSLNKKWNSGPSLVVGWNHVSVTMNNAKHASYSGKIITGFSYSGTTMYATNIKFEFGNTDTPWCPNSADSIYTTLGYNNTIEYDTSGYKNNGTRTNIEVLNANPPKHSAASYFKGSSYIACGRNTMVTDAITINVWVYSSNWTNYVQTLASCTESGGWSFGISGSNFNWYMGTGTSSNTYKTISIAASTFTAGWHMITVTYDGLAVKGYIDAVLKGTNAAYTEKTPIFYNTSNGVFIGAEAGGNQTTPAGSYSTCNMSDFRIYAAALSTDDIQELYQTSASITNNGAIICYDFTEN